MDANGKMVKEPSMKMAEIYTEGDANKMKLAEEIIDVCMAINVSADP